MTYTILEDDGTLVVRMQGRLDRQAVDVHFARSLDGVVRITAFVDGNSDATRRAGDLHDCVADHTVVLFSVARCENVKSVFYFEER
jgi:hypothetical protein